VVQRPLVPREKIVDNFDNLCLERPLFTARLSVLRDVAKIRASAYLHAMLWFSCSIELDPITIASPSEILPSSELQPSKGKLGKEEAVFNLPTTYSQQESSV
jgi:hypothetical protein